MDYVGDLALVQQDLARSHDMDRRRSRVLQALAPVPGERIIEVGCGGGLLLLEIGRAVDPDGTVLGVDVSEDQVAAARRACTGVSNVRAEVGSATALDADDGCFDASVSTQVLEYIEDVGVALAELARVTRVGGRFVNVATNWDSLFVAGGDVELTERIIGAWDRHAPHPNLPVALPNHLTRAGYSSVLQTPLPLANRTFNRSTFAFGIANLMAAFAVAAGAIDDHSSRSWLSSLDKASRRGDLFISVMPMMTTATRAESTRASAGCCCGRAENYDTDGRTQSTRPADRVIVVLGLGYRVSGERVKMHRGGFGEPEGQIAPAVAPLTSTRGDERGGRGELRRS